MRNIAVSMRVALVLAGLGLAVASAAAQDGGGGGVLPGANGVQQPGGRGVTTCSARNALATKQCTATCQPGQTADCADSDDGSDPSCACSGP